MTSEPISPELIKRMNEVARFLDEIFNGINEPKKIGFALLTYKFGEQIEGTGRVNYIGNGERKDVVNALRELIGRWEKELPK